MKSETNVLARFPKTRPPLPESYREIYAEHYRQNRRGETPAASLSQKMESWMHRQVAADTPSRAPGYSTLEVGAGALNHLQYESSSQVYDVMEPLTMLVDPRRVRNVFSSLDEIHEQRYDRIVSIASFEHQCELPRIVAQCGLLLKSGGQLRVAIPSEGTLLWTLGWKLTTGLEFRWKRGLDYGVLMRHEHVNSAAEIEAVLRFFFRNVRRAVFGLSAGLSFYQFFECSDPDATRCADLMR